MPADPTVLTLAYYAVNADLLVADTTDVRPGRGDEKWPNLLLRKA